MSNRDRQNGAGMLQGAPYYKKNYTKRKYARRLETELMKNKFEDSIK